MQPIEKSKVINKLLGKLGIAGYKKVSKGAFLVEVPGSNKCLIKIPSYPKWNNAEKATLCYRSSVWEYDAKSGKYSNAPLLNGSPSDPLTIQRVSDIALSYARPKVPKKETMVVPQEVIPFPTPIENPKLLELRSLVRALCQEYVDPNVIYKCVSEEISSSKANARNWMALFTDNVKL